MAQRYATPIHLSRHAIQRWRERVGDDETTTMQVKIRRGIRAALRKGKRINRRGAIVVNVHPGIRAVVVPDFRGGWFVVTVMVEEEREGDADAV